MHPLASISEQVEATGYYSDLRLTQLDSFGNPVFDKSNPITLTLLIKNQGVVSYKSSPGQDKPVQLVKCFVLNADFTFENLIQLSDDLVLQDGRSLTITSKSQGLLKPLNNVFGLRFLGMIY